MVAFPRPRSLPVRGSGGGHADSGAPGNPLFDSNPGARLDPGPSPHPDYRRGITSEWVAQIRLGRVVPPFDSQAVGRALSDLLSETRKERAPFFDPLHQRLHWSSVVEPLGGIASKALMPRTVRTAP